MGETFGIDREEAAELRAMARSGVFRVMARARIVLAAERGEAPASIARRLQVTPATVRLWMRRFREGRVAGLADRPGKGRRPAGKAAVAGRPGGAQAPRNRGGRPAAKSGAIVAWVRDAAAEGRIAPNAALPSNAFFEKTFKCPPSTVQRAMAALVREGFAVARRGLERRLAARPPFAGRYLLVSRRDLPGSFGAALAEAARTVAARRGIVFGAVAAPDAAADSGAAARFWERLRAEMEAQRWSGVFLDHFDQRQFRCGVPPTLIGHVPVCGRIIADARGLGRHVVSIGRAVEDGGSKPGMGTLLRECAGRGIRSVAALAAIATYDESAPPWDAAPLRRLAAGFGIAIPPCALQGVLAHQRDTVRIAAETLALVGEREGVGAFLCEIDGFAVEMSRALAGRLGADEAANRLIVAMGNRPLLPETAVPVAWHGWDLTAALESFVDWCEAIHAGAKDPAPPVVATF